MPRSIALLAALLVCSLLFVGACGEEEQPPPPPDELPDDTIDEAADIPTLDDVMADDEQEKDIVETAMAADGFATLVQAVQAGGLTDTLKAPGPFTVFAPTDAAFDALPEGALQDLLKPENVRKLQDILKYHVVAGRLDSSAVADADQVETVLGESIEVSVSEDGAVMIGGAEVVQADIECSNGVIHGIDAVLLPPAEDTPPDDDAETPTDEADIVATARAAGNFQTLIAALEAAQLVDVLEGKGPFTVFAPTDAAFDALPEGTLENLLKPENADTLRTILLFHVVPDKLTASDVAGMQVIPTAADIPLTVQPAKGAIVVQGASVSGADIECSNGVIHVIDAVMLPPQPEETPATEPTD